MTVFLAFIPAPSAKDHPIPPGPMEFFTSIEVAQWKLEERAQNKRGLRALAAATEKHSYSEWQRVAEMTEFPKVGAWKALVWWRRGDESAPGPNDPYAEVWTPNHLGKVERERLTSAEWNTGKKNNGKNAKPKVDAP